MEYLFSFNVLKLKNELKDSLQILGGLLKQIYTFFFLILPVL